MTSFSESQFYAQISWYCSMYWLIHVVAGTKCLTKSPSLEKELILVHGVSVESIVVGRAWQQGVEHLVTLVLWSKGRKSQTLMLRFFVSLFYFFFLSQSGIHIHMSIIVTFRLGLLSSAKPPQKHAHRHVQRCVSQEIINPIKLSMQLNYHISKTVYRVSLVGRTVFCILYSLITKQSRKKKMLPFSQNLYSSRSKTPQGCTEVIKIENEEDSDSL